MINFKFLGFTFNVFYTVNMLVTDVIPDITRQEHFRFEYCISVRDYSNSSAETTVNVLSDI